MKELEKSFKGKGEVKGFMFTQIKKTEHAYIYKVDYYGGTHYEVFERKENERWDCISYPKSKSFGVWAWTYRNISDAVNKSLEIENAKSLQV